MWEAVEEEEEEEGVLVVVLVARKHTDVFEMIEAGRQQLIGLVDQKTFSSMKKPFQK